MKKKIYVLFVLVFLLITSIFFIYLFWSELAINKKSEMEENKRLSEIFSNTPVEAILINQQFSNITAKNKEKIIANYSKDIKILWEGSFLNGEYEGIDASRVFWNNFFGKIAFDSAEIKNIVCSREGDKTSAFVVFYNNQGGQNEKLEKVYEVEVDLDSGKIKRESWKDDDSDSNEKETELETSSQDVVSGKIESVNQQKITLLSNDGSRRILELTPETELVSDSERISEVQSIEDIRSGQNAYISFDVNSKKIISLFIIN